MNETSITRYENDIEVCVKLDGPSGGVDSAHGFNVTIYHTELIGIYTIQYASYVYYSHTYA